MSCYTCVHRFLTSLPCCYSDDYSHARLKELPTVALDTERIGSEAVVVKNGKRLCGSGAALANTSISQSKAYFEAKVQQNGVWGIGLGSRKVDLNRLPLGKDMESLVLREDSKVYHDNNVVATLPQKVEEGDTLGIGFDHEMVSLYLDGQALECSVPAPKLKPIYPLFYEYKYMITLMRENIRKARQLSLTYRYIDDITNIKVDDGAILDVHLSEVTNPLPFGFHPIMVEQTIL